MDKDTFAQTLKSFKREYCRGDGESSSQDNTVQVCEPGLIEQSPIVLDESDN